MACSRGRTSAITPWPSERTNALLRLCIPERPQPAPTTTSFPSQAGVTSASVSLMSRTALIRYDSSLTDPATLIAAVRSLGFSASALSPTNGPLSDNPLSSSALSREALIWRRQFIGSLIFTLPVVIIAMVLPHTSAGPTMDVEVVPGLPIDVFVLWLLVTPVQFGFGFQFYRRAWRALSHRSANMDVLVRA
eukprot:scaffold67204_cov30-Tisochrysis_lutea.AAC.7